MAGRADNLRVAIGAMLAMTFALSLGDALIKGVADRMSVWQLFVMRSLIVLPILGAIAFVWPGWRMLRVERGKWVAFRSVLLVVNWLVYYTALPLMPLPLVVATLYTAPIFTTLFAAVLLGDPIGRAGWAGVLLGFAGVLLVIQPGSDGVGWVALLPVAAAVLYALNAIVTRAKCREEHPMVLAL